MFQTTTHFKYMNQHNGWCTTANGDIRHATPSRNSYNPRSHL